MSTIHELSIEDLYFFLECPVKYLLNKQGKVTYHSEKKEDAIIFEAVMKRYYLDKLDGKEPTIDDVLKNTSQIMFNMEGYSLLDASRMKRIREKKAIEMAGVFAKHETGLQQEIVAFSQPFTLKYSDTLIIRDEIPLVRIIDGLVELVSFKTSRKKVSPFYLDTNMAMTIYDMAFVSVFDRKPDRIASYHIPSQSIHHTHREEWQYKRLFKTLDYVDEQLRNNSYHTRETFLCDDCNARYSCLDYYKK